MSSEEIQAKSGMFQFKTLTPHGSNYVIELGTENCDISNQAGQITSNVDNVVVDCTDGHTNPGRYRLGGVIQNIQDENSVLLIDDGAATSEEK